MYMILFWVDDSYLSCIKNSNGSIRLFESIKEADDWANYSKAGESLRVISIEGVKE